MSNQQYKTNAILAPLLLAIGIALAGYFISNTLYNSKIALNTADVKGLAERRVEADSAFWSIQYTVTGNQKADIANLYKESENDQSEIIALLTENGFSEDEIQPGIINYVNQEYRDKNQVLVEQKHSLIGQIEVQTKKVKQVAKVRAKLNKLIAKGLDIQNNAPAYYFTKLNDIKPAMLKEATKNARIAATTFAENVGASVGGIKSARQGSFSIRDAGEEYGDRNKIEKDIRVVTTVSFYIEN